MGSGCCETVNGFESVWVHAFVSGVITRRQFCVLARKAHSETPTCISRYICPFANALLGKLSRIDLHALAFPRDVHKKKKRGSETPTCISRYVCPFANALLGKLSRTDLHALALPRDVHRN